MELCRVIRGRVVFIAAPADINRNHPHSVAAATAKLDLERPR